MHGSYDLCHYILMSGKQKFPEVLCLYMYGLFQIVHSDKECTWIITRWVSGLSLFSGTQQCVFLTTSECGLFEWLYHETYWTSLTPVIPIPGTDVKTRFKWGYSCVVFILSPTGLLVILRVLMNRGFSSSRCVFSLLSFVSVTSEVSCWLNGLQRTAV